MAEKVYNLVIIGGGPAGLSAAISGGSELSDVALIDSGKKTGPNCWEGIIGGQIRETACIENHPGVIAASGCEIVEIFRTQAERMGVEIHCPMHATSLKMVDDDLKQITTREGRVFTARAVLLAPGLSYRHLPQRTRVDDFIGRGVKYGAMDINPGDLGECNIGIVGAANSAGQAVLNLAKNTKARITIYVRGKKTLRDGMSEYLVDRIEKNSQIEVKQDVEVGLAEGNGHLEQVTLRHGDGSETSEKCDHLFVFIGAMPKVDWLNGAVLMNHRGFILTGPQLGQTAGFTPFMFETSMSGVFAAGDILLNPTKRVTTATGHGSAAVSMIHQYFTAIDSGERKPTRI